MENFESFLLPTGLLSESARIRIDRAVREAGERVLCSLASLDNNRTAEAEIVRYLTAVRSNFPEIDQYTDRMLEQTATTLDNVEMIITIPVVGFGDQEQSSIRQTLDMLASQSLLISGRAAIALFVNRPQGVEADSTMQAITEWKIQNSGIKLILFEGEMSPTIGRSTSPYYEDFEPTDQSVRIALLRDILNIVVMKLWQRQSTTTTTPPILLQGDADLWRLSGIFELEELERMFTSDPSCMFVQCTTDWDGPLATSKIPAMWLGSELMRELPQTFKRSLNNGAPTEQLVQYVFGETIQRGIQVPQAERMETIARKGGYGLLKISEDELDMNLRMTALFSGVTSIKSTADIVFYYSNRRAVAAWLEKREPPIKQWSVEFTGKDYVRTRQFEIPMSSDREMIEEALAAANRTLQRFPLPMPYFEVLSFEVMNILARYGLGPDACEFQIIPNGIGDEATLQISKLNKADVFEQILLNLS